MKILIANSKETFEIKYDSTDGGTYRLYSLDNPDYTIRLDETGLYELKQMIDEILQHVNKRDW